MKRAAVAAIGLMTGLTMLTVLMRPLRIVLQRNQELYI